MEKSKIGRPTDMPKDIMLKLRIAEKTRQELIYCVENEGKNKSEIVRNAIHDYYEKIKKAD